MLDALSPGEEGLDGFGLSADVRVGYFQWEIDDRDATSRSEDLVGSRWRFRAEAQLNPHLRAVGRIAGICTDEECTV